MTVGIAQTTLAHKWLDMLGGTAFTAPTNTYSQLHTADPGAAGTTSPCNGASSAGTRKVLAWAAASAGSKAIQATLPSWTSWDGGSVTITHVSTWDAAGSGNPASGGNYLFSAALSSGKPITNGDTFNLTSMSIGLTPIAA